MTCQTHKIKVSFKITISERHIYIDNRWPWKWKWYFYLGIWEDESTKIIFLPPFQLVTRLNSQNRNETSLLMNTYNFFTLFQFITRLLLSNHFNLISSLLTGQNGVMRKTCFSASQNAKNESQLQHKNLVRYRHFIGS